MFDLDFQGHAMKIEFFIITVGFPDPREHAYTHFVL